MTDIHSLSDDEIMALVLDDSTMTDDKEVTEDSNTDAVEEPVEPVETNQDDTSTDVPDDAQDSVESNTEQNTAIETDETEESTVDYESFYTTLTKPIKANGREMVVTDPKDIIRLMQMGANYSKKMEQLKPSQSILKALKENNLDDPDKIGFLIDLAHKKPEAIAKLVKDSEFDIYSVDDEQVNAYQPSQVKQITEFETVLTEVMDDNPNMSNVLGLMNTWDDTSKSIIYQQPEMLRLFSQQQADGTFDKIHSIIERERMLGRMLNMSYLDAYSQVEAQVLKQYQQQQQQNSFTAPRPNNQTNSNQGNSAVEQKRKASLPNGKSTTVNQEIAIDKMSDEEILAMFPTY